MTMTEWAENEVKIACKKEAPDRKDGEWDYGCACYESALKAYKSLMDDNHSGFSFGMTKNILIRLMNHQPLTPIEDTDDMWNGVSDGVYQCKRMSSLFKHVDNGKIRYSDNDRIIFFDGDISCHSSFVNHMFNEMFPITMPYYPSIYRYEVYGRTYFVDDNGVEIEKPGEFNVREIYYYITPERERVEFHKKYVEDENGEFVEVKE